MPRCGVPLAVRPLITAVLVLAVSFAGTGCGDDEGEATVTIAFLRAVPGDDVDPLLDELRTAGFVPGDDLALLPEDHLGTIHPDPDDARRVVRDWVEQGVDLVFAFSSTGATAAAEATASVPVLFLVNDPMAVGLVEDEESPSGNLTGVTFRVPADRTLDLARRAVPGLARVGFLFPEVDPAAAPHREAVEAAGGRLGIDIVAEAFTSEDDVGRALDALVAAGVGAVFVANAPTAVRALGVIEPAVAERGLPLVANVALTFAPSALVAVTPDADELQAQLGRQAVRILEGTAPRDIPVEDPRRFRVLLNARRADELGLPPLPDGLLRQADEVVQ